MHCRVRLSPTDKPDVKGTAETWHRIIRVITRWPKEHDFFMPEHWILYDFELKPAAAARCIAHELWHILDHDPTAAGREVNPDHSVVYSTDEERQADLFSLVMLRNEPFDQRPAPQSTEEFLALLDGEAGMPSYLSAAEIAELAPEFEL